jgi:hypothetical protein
MKKLLALNISVVCIFFIMSCDIGWPYRPEEFKIPAPDLIDDFINRDSLADFTGIDADSIIFVFTLQLNNGGRTIYFVNFKEAIPVALRLKKPADKPDWDADSPLLSPDGKLVTYYLLNPEDISASQGATFVQRLDTSAVPVQITAKGSEPHFYMDKINNLYVIYADTCGKIDAKLDAISGNATFKQKIDASTGEKIGEPVQIISKPFYGGISKDGRYLCTAYSNAYFYDVQNSRLISINTDRQTCNASISPDPQHPDQMMFLSINGVQNMSNDPFKSTSLTQHRVVYIVDATNSVVEAFDINSLLSYPDGSGWQDPEWSNKPNFFCTLAKSEGVGGTWDCFLVRISDKKMLKLNTPPLEFSSTATPSVHLGVNP